MNKKKKIEKENWFTKAVKPTEVELLILQLLIPHLVDKIDKEIKKGTEASEAVIKCAKKILKRNKKEEK